MSKEKAKSKTELYYQLGKKKISEQEEENFMAFYELALLGAERGRHEESLEHLKKVIALKPDFSKAHLSMGNAYYNLGKYGDALASYNNALQFEPASRDAILMSATCEVLTGNAERAIAVLETDLSNDSTHLQALLVLAEAYFCVGMKEKGLEFTKKLKNMHFNIEETFVQFARMLVSAGKIRLCIIIA